VSVINALCHYTDYHNCQCHQCFVSLYRLSLLSVSLMLSIKIFVVMVSVIHVECHIFMVIVEKKSVEFFIQEFI
jgi:hypothetical protein